MPNSTDIDESRLLRELLDRLETAIIVADDDGIYVEVNRAACRLFERPRSELLGRKVTDFIDIERTEEVDVQWDAFRRDGRQSGLFEIRLPDGSPRKLRFHAEANLLPGLHCSFMTDVPATAGEPSGASDPITLCAWTKQVKLQDEWVSIEAYLERRHGISVTHGISPHAFDAFQDES